MSLRILTGSDGTMNHEIVCLALEGSPSILIDSANSADIHNFQGYSPEQFANVHVIEVEALYRLTTTLKKIRETAKQLKTKKIFITTYRLYNYSDDDENRNIFIYSWELLALLARELEIVAAVEKGSIHEHLAKINGAIEYEKKEENMGHTLTSQRMVVDNIISDLENFGKSLSGEDREIYAQLIREPLKHLGSITYTSSMNTWAIFLLCIMIEKEKNERMAYRQLQG